MRNWYCAQQTIFLNLLPFDLWSVSYYKVTLLLFSGSEAMFADLGHFNQLSIQCSKKNPAVSTGEEMFAAN